MVKHQIPGFIHASGRRFTPKLGQLRPLGIFDKDLACSLLITDIASAQEELSRTSSPIAPTGTSW